MVRNVPFWLSDEQWCWTEPHLTTNWRRTGGRSTRHQWDRAFAEEGYRWCDRPPEYGPHLTIYNRFGFRQGRYLRRASRPNLRHLDNQAPQRAWPLRSSIPSGPNALGLATLNFTTVHAATTAIQKLNLTIVKFSVRRVSTPTRSDRINGRKLWKSSRPTCWWLELDPPG
jgi:hypothetical protein